MFYAALLIEKGINVNIKNKEGNTALMLCASNNPKENVRIIQLLLNSKADADLINNEGDTFYSIMGKEAKNNHYKSEANIQEDNIKTYKTEVFFFLIMPLIAIWLAHRLI